MESANADIFPDTSIIQEPEGRRTLAQANRPILVDPMSQA
jgi:hypothetical protein